ncbi:hypothetical protein AURDEDRAFT_124142 [Auricularia subglabra TFB-10046 SS5]|nr:hypothetical protein AURDEDRAFT_124142 [Auricularia subglabra TFB-10046 SS5]
MPSPGAQGILLVDATGGHQRTESNDSQTTLVEDGALAETKANDEQRSFARATSDDEDIVADAKRFQVTAEPATGPGTTKAGTPTAAAPYTESVFTTAALAVVDKPINADNGHDEVQSNAANDGLLAVTDEDETGREQAVERTAAAASVVDSAAPLAVAAAYEDAAAATTARWPVDAPTTTFRTDTDSGVSDVDSEYAVVSSPAAAPSPAPARGFQHLRASDGEAIGQLANTDFQHEYDYVAMTVRAERDPNAPWPCGYFGPPQGYTAVSSLLEYVPPRRPRMEDEEDGEGYCNCNNCVSRGGSNCADCYDNCIVCTGEGCVYCSWDDGLPCVCDDCIYGPHASDDESIYCTCDDCISCGGSDCAYCYDDDYISCIGEDCVYCGSGDWIPCDGEDCICCSCDDGAPCVCDDCVYGVGCVCDDCIYGPHVSYSVNDEELESDAEDSELEPECQDETLESEGVDDEEPVPSATTRDQDELDRQATVAMEKIAATVQNIIEDRQGCGWNNGHLLERGDGNDADLDEVNNVDDA